MGKEKLIHIAYAEDHISVREGIVLFLQQLGGISVDIQANNGIDMLAQLNGSKRLPDVCMIDINMPGMDGFNLLIEIKKRWPDMRSLILTMFNSEAHIIRMIKNGANGYLLKECEVTEIKDALNSIHHTGYYYSKVADKDKFASVLNDPSKQLLTATENEFMALATSGMKYEEIATKMNRSLSSVKNLRDRVFRKLKLNNKTSLAKFAIESGDAPL